ncbi:hypothetical protein [Yeosuana marina]|uniref:hypothetical protein n=1 Tax=Yeosuana marina TaxID=1565536 RepID=UPI00142139C8|nr:hypothetical protein [Yeosuana marina]
MKTKTILSLLLITSIGIQTITAQSLRKKVKKSVEALTEQINTLSQEEITQLDQIAFKIKKIAFNNEGTDVLFIDNSNTENSQLAMIWLNTAFQYYNLKIESQSAGINIDVNKPISGFNSLSQYGFSVKKANTGKPNQYWVEYSNGSSWLVFAKSLKDVQQNTSKGLSIIVDNSQIDNENLTIKFDLSNEDELPLQMVYIAAQINHLNKTKN